MRDLVTSWTGVTALVGIVAFAVFALPTPEWVGWPALAIALIALGRLIVVGDRRHRQLRDRLDLDNEANTESRAEGIADFLGKDGKR